MTSPRLLALILLCAGCAHSVVPTRPPRAPLTLTYLGVAGWEIAGDGHRVLIDPYFSRPPRELPGGLLAPDDAAIADHAPAKADLILVGHSHIDHLLDVPAIALRTGAQVLGTVSTARVALAAGVPADHVIPVKGGEDYQFDGFSVRVIPSLHSALGEKHTFAGNREIPPGVTLPLSFDGYAEGGTLAYLVRLGGWEILVLSTANFIERELEGIRPDIAIVAVGLREELHDYSCRLMRALGSPPIVYANHFDAWREPLGPKQLDIGEDGRADLAAFADEIHRCAPQTRVIVPVHFAPLPHSDPR